MVVHGAVGLLPMRMITAMTFAPGESGQASHRSGRKGPGDRGEGNDGGHRDVFDAGHALQQGSVQQRRARRKCDDEPQQWGLLCASRSNIHEIPLLTLGQIVKCTPAVLQGTASTGKHLNNGVTGVSASMSAVLGAVQLRCALERENVEGVTRMQAEISTAL